MDKFLHEKVLDVILRDDFGPMLEAYYSKLTTGPENRPLTEQEREHYINQVVKKAIKDIIAYTPSA